MVTLFLCFILQRESHSLIVQLLQRADERLQAFFAVRLMVAEYTVKGILAVIGNPGKLSAVVIQETGGKAYASSCCNIGKGGFMIGTVEIADFSR